MFPSLTCNIYSAAVLSKNPVFTIGNALVKAKSMKKVLLISLSFVHDYRKECVVSFLLYGAYF
jgi:hypothetical protein